MLRLSSKNWFHGIFVNKCSSSTNNKIPQFPQNIRAVDHRCDFHSELTFWLNIYQSIYTIWIQRTLTFSKKIRIHSFTGQSYFFMLWFAHRKIYLVKLPHTHTLLSRKNQRTENLEEHCGDLVVGLQLNWQKCCVHFSMILLTKLIRSS